MKEQKELKKLRAQDQLEIQAFKRDLQRKEKVTAEMAALPLLRIMCEASAQMTGKVDQLRSTAHGDLADH